VAVRREREGEREKEREREGEQRERDRRRIFGHGMMVVVVVVVVVVVLCHRRIIIDCTLACMQDHAFPQLPWHTADSCVECACFNIRQRWSNAQTNSQSVKSII
jgi:hypothetical protein